MGEGNGVASVIMLIMPGSHADTACAVVGLFQGVDELCWQIM